MAGSDGGGVRTRFTQAPGISFIAIATQVGPTRGIEIDNPSGSWLYIPSLETFIPPYTTGWAFGFPYDVASLDVLSKDRQPTGPAAQISTLQGDPVTIYLTDLQLDRKVGVAAAGSPSSDQNFITAFTPILSAQIFGAATVSGAGSSLPTIIIPAIANKRIRLYSWGVTRGQTGIAGSGILVGGEFVASLEDSAGSQKDTISLDWYETKDVRLYTQGLDFPVSLGVSMEVFPSWADIPIMFSTVTYSVI